MKKILFLAGILLQLSYSYAQQFKVGTVVNEYPSVKWIKGDPITKLDSTKIYIVECWATWCGPCKAAMPHLNELHKKYGDKITIIGQDVAETDFNKVEKFVKDKGDGMAYRVAFAGDKESDFMKNWFDAARITGIPASIVIKNNRVVWMPNPGMLTDAVVEHLISPDFTPASATRVMQNEDEYKLMEFYRDAKYDSALVIINRILAKKPTDNTALALKIAIFKNTGKEKERTVFIDSCHAAGYNPTVANLYYRMLLEKEQYREVIAAAKNDLARTATQKIDRSEAISAGYIAYMKTGDPQNALIFLSNIVKGSRVEDLGWISTLGMSSRNITPTKELEELFYTAAKKYMNTSDPNARQLLRVVDYQVNKQQPEAAAVLVDAYLKNYNKKDADMAIIDKLTVLDQRLHKGEHPTEKELEEIIPQP